MKINRNDECWCNSGLKYKKCHMEFDEKLKSLRERGFEVPSHNIIKTKGGVSMKKVLLIILAVIVVAALAVGVYLLIPKNSTKVTFEGEQCLAIGFIANGKEKDFSEKYLNGSEDFNKLTTITSGDEDQFVVVPKGKDSKIKVWTYKVTEAGEIVIDKVIAENVSEPILIKAETAEVVPKVGIEYEGNNQKIVLPLILSGKDGKIILGEKSNLIKDISEY